VSREGRPYFDRRKGVVNVYDVACPKCEARAGEPCVNQVTVADLEHPHRERELAAREESDD
jgi:hypothetical protein